MIKLGKSPHRMLPSVCPVCTLPMTVRIRIHSTWVCPPCYKKTVIERAENNDGLFYLSHHQYIRFGDDLPHFEIPVIVDETLPDNQFIVKSGKQLIRVQL